MANLPNIDSDRDILSNRGQDRGYNEENSLEKSCKTFIFLLTH